MYQEEVMIPVGDWAKTRLNNLSETDKTRDESRVDSGFGKNISNWVGRDKVYPTNVIHMATECSNKNHSAAFPEDLPTWFIKLFTQPNDIVLDPFVGSGTTAVSAKRLKRNYVGIDINDLYCETAVQRVMQTQPRLLEERGPYNVETKNGTAIV
jgi:DNA modification methylase